MNTVAIKKNIKILIVDDNPEHSFLMCKALEESNLSCKVECCESSIEARNKILNSKFDAALIDYKMSGTNGLDFLYSIIEEGYDFPVIMVTGQGDEKVAVEAMKVGAYDYIAKTVGFTTTLPHILKNALDRYNLKKELRDSEEKYRLLAETAREIIAIYNLNGKIKYLNKAAKQVTGYFDSNRSSLYIDDLVSQEDLDEMIVRKDKRINGDENLFQYEVTIVTKAGNRIPFEMNSMPIKKYDKVTDIMIIGRDISERKNAEEKLKMKAEELARSNSELEEFAYIASHDLQEPLHKIQAFCDMIISRYSLGMNAKGMGYLYRIQGSAGRMYKLIDNLLVLSRVRTRSAPFEKVDLNDIIDDVISDLELRINKIGGALKIKKLPIIEADSIQMHQLFTNLISNSVKFYRLDVNPEIKISSQIIKNAEVNSEHSNNSDHCKIFVKDNGIGFDVKYVERIFQPFQRLHGRSVYEGTGIGLAICQNIVERHSGKISANSKSGKGTTMIITIPISQEGKI